MLRRGPPSERRASVMLEEEAACCEEALSPDEPGEGGLSSDAELRAAAQRQQGGDGSRMVERMDSEEGTRELLDQVDQRISSPSFLQTLRALPSDAYHTLPDGPSPKASPSCKKRGALSWLRGRAEKPTQSVGAEPVFVEPAAADESCGGEFVIIASDEVLESVTLFIAQFIRSHPEASQLSPEELQKILLSAMKRLKRSRPRRLFDWGWKHRKPVRVVFGAASAVTHAPWAIKCIGWAMYAAARVAVGLVVPC